MDAVEHARSVRRGLFHGCRRVMGTTKRLLRSPKAWSVAAILVIVLLIVYYALMEHFAPITSDAYVQTYVVQIAPQLAGEVIEVNVSDDTFVKAGQLLFALDPRPYQYRVNQLNAALVLTKHQVEQLENLRDAAAAGVAAAQAELSNAQWHLKEQTRLLPSGASSKEEVEDARARVKAREANLNFKNAELAKTANQISAKIDGVHASIKRTEAELAEARYDLERTQVTAPFDGRVTNLQLTRGFFLKEGDPVMTLVDQNRRWLVANFRENSLGVMRVGMAAEFNIAMYPSQVFATRIESLGWGVEQGQGKPSGLLPAVETPTYWVKLPQRFPVRLTLPARSDLTWRVGSSVTVAVYTGRSPILESLSALWLRIGSYLHYLL